MESNKYLLWLDEVGIEDIDRVGGKNASLGEMIRHLGDKGVKVPPGYIVTAEAYRYFMARAGLDLLVKETLAGLDTRNLKDLVRRGKFIREAIVRAAFPSNLTVVMACYYAELERRCGNNIDVAVRSSATAEDLPGASFAGEHETYLGVRGTQSIERAVKSAMASLFTDRAISYRVDKGFDHHSVSLSVGVQRMVRSDKGASGVLFTLDTESGFRNVVLINAAWGLGEMVVQGRATPDEYLVAKATLSSAKNPVIGRHLGSKAIKMVYGGRKDAHAATKTIATSPKERDTFVLTDEEAFALAHAGVAIESHYTAKYGKWTPMDIEWAKDGVTGELFIVQARPETIHAERDVSKRKEYVRKGDGVSIVTGASVGSKIVAGKARVIRSVKDIALLKPGEVLVTTMTDPDWEPIMKIAAAIVTDKGGRTSHAAIVARELGIPAVVGTEYATKRIKTGQMITVDTTGSEGAVFAGKVPYTVVEYDAEEVPETRTKIMVNIATPDTAFEKSFLPNAGVGLAREEFIIASTIGIHPLALIHYRTLDRALKKQIDKRTRGWQDKRAFYIDNLAYGIGKIAAAFHPHPVIVRFSDFKTNEYRSLLGGNLYEPHEENPMLGWRGASRYYDPAFKDAFILEVLAIRKVREEMGLDNVIPMVPFCRTPEEGRKTLEIMAKEGLVSTSMQAERGNAGPSVPVYVMCEIPSNVLRADEFLDLFDGMSIGSNDLTQLVLGLDRDAGTLSHVGDGNDPAVKKMVAEAIAACKKRGKYIGICGQAPSDYPEFAAFLVEQGIDSISLNPDTVVVTTIAIAREERRQQNVQ